MVCGTPSTNSPAEVCARAVPVAQISPQLWAETPAVETVAPSTFRCYDWIPRSTVTADPHTREIKQISQFMRPQTSQGVRPVQPGPDKISEKDWKKAHKHEKPNRENSRKESSSDCRGASRRIFHVREPEKSQHPSDSPTRTNRSDPGGAGRETRPGRGSPLDRRRHRAR